MPIIAKELDGGQQRDLKKKKRNENLNNEQQNQFYP